MSNKRFKGVFNYDWWGVIDTTGEIKGEYTKGCFSTDTVVDLLNELHDKCKFLEIENESLEDSGLYYAELYQKVFKENEQLKKQIEELTFKLRTIEAYDRTVKKEHSDTVYDFKKKLDSW